MAVHLFSTLWVQETLAESTWVTLLPQILFIWTMLVQVVLRQIMFVLMTHCSTSVIQQNLPEKRQLMDMCSSVIAQVQAAGVSENIVQYLTCSMEEVVNDVHVQTQDAVLKCLSSEVNEQTLNKVKECFENIENPFTHLNTETKRQRYFENKWKIVEPIECVLGVRYDTRLDKTTGVYSQIPVNDKFMYVPILGTRVIV